MQLENIATYYICYWGEILKIKYIILGRPDWASASKICVLLEEFIRSVWCVTVFLIFNLNVFSSVFFTRISIAWHSCGLGCGATVSLAGISSLPACESVITSLVAWHTEIWKLLCRPQSFGRHWSAFVSGLCAWKPSAILAQNTAIWKPCGSFSNLLVQSLRNQLLFYLW